MFSRLHDSESQALPFEFEGKAFVGAAGDSVAAALIAAGEAAFRQTPISGAPRGPYCAMGVCFECLFVIDGVGGQQACMTRLRDGMKIQRQDGARRLDL